MSIVTTYTCDRCSHQQTTADQMWNVAISYQHEATHAFSPSVRSKQLWCRNCCNKFNIIVDSPKTKDVEAPREITLEDKIREIIRDVVETVSRE